MALSKSKKIRDKIKNEKGYDPNEIRRGGNVTSISLVTKKTKTKRESLLNFENKHKNWNNY